jgi:hypothetical protein
MPAIFAECPGGGGGVGGGGGGGGGGGVAFGCIVDVGTGVAFGCIVDVGTGVDVTAVVAIGFGVSVTAVVAVGFGVGVPGVTCCLPNCATTTAPLLNARSSTTTMVTMTTANWRLLGDRGDCGEGCGAFSRSFSASEGEVLIGLLLVKSPQKTLVLSFIIRNTIHKTDHRLITTDVKRISERSQLSSSAGFLTSPSRYAQLYGR